MKVEHVSARAFGPLRASRLSFAPGLTVIAGPNEAAKSSWCAALYAALCGLRRGGGRSNEDKEFEVQYRPWQSDAWEVSCVVTLSSGLQLEVRQELLHRTDCHVTDLTTGADLTSSYLQDGTPCLASLVGLDRRTFLSTAMVRQADVIAATTASQALTEQLQRAAATAGSDATAAQALTVLNSYRHDHVGASHKAAVGPLKQAQNALDVATRNVAQADRDHRELAAITTQATQLELAAQAAHRDRDLCEAAVAVRDAREVRRRLIHVRALLAEGPPPVAPDVTYLDEVTEALATYSEFTENESLQNLSSEQELARLESELAGAPTTSDVPQSCQQAFASFQASHTALRSISIPPAMPPLYEQTTAAELQGLAAVLVSPLSTASLVTAGTIVLLSVLAAVALTPLLAIVAVGAVSWLAIYRHRRLSAARHRCAQLSVSATPAACSLAGVELSSYMTSLDSAQHYAHVTASHAAATQRLAFELTAAGIVDFDMSDDSLYAAFAQLRADMASQATHHEATEMRLVELRSRCSQSAARRTTLNDRLATLAACVHISPSTPEQAIAQALTTWRDETRAAARLSNSSREIRHALELELDGTTVDELAALDTKMTAYAREKATSVDTALLSELASSDALDERLTVARTQVEQASAVSATAHGSLRTRLENAIDVVAAHEDLARARANLAAVERLDNVLSITSALLDKAQNQVHRDIAPLLNAAITDRIQDATSGRYVSALVNPDDLSVTVEDAHGYRRPASQLSHGTTELVYLLLRVALVELVSPDESCPLIFDDVTVNCDAARTEAVLSTLKAVADSGRQIVVFSSQAMVRSWAQQHLGPTDSLVELPQVVIASPQESAQLFANSPVS